MASGVILWNLKGEILILKTTYKDHWEIPGGVVEENESPRQTAERETFEEIGLRLTLSKCLVIHYRSPQGDQDDSIMFVFDGGLWDESQKLVLDAREIAEARFLPIKEASKLVGERIASRLSFCLQARAENRTIYLESVTTFEPDFIS